jgi:hypothetical protein
VVVLGTGGAIDIGLEVPHRAAARTDGGRPACCYASTRKLRAGRPACQFCHIVT